MSKVIVSYARREDLAGRPIQLVAETLPNDLWEKAHYVGVYIAANFDGVVEWGDFVAAVAGVTAQLQRHAPGLTVTPKYHEVKLQDGERGI